MYCTSSIYTPTTNISQQHKIPPSTNNNIHKHNTQYDFLSGTEGSRCHQSKVLDDVVAQHNTLHPRLDTDITTTTSSTPALAASTAVYATQHAKVPYNSSTCFRPISSAALFTPTSMQ